MSYDKEGEMVTLKGRLVVMALILTLGAIVVTVARAPHAEATPGWSDFNRDGYVDLVVGVPEEDVGAAVDAGAVHILYGTSTGLTATNDQLFYQGWAGLPDRPEDGDRFGAAVETGEFNGDSYDDLAIGAPREDLGPATDAGMVHILYGSANGLVGSSLTMSQPPTFNGTSDPAETGDQFGAALVTGRFNGDWMDDLVIGIPGEDVVNELGTTVVDAGMIEVRYGAASGTRTLGRQAWTLAGGGVPGSPSSRAGFGFSLAAGDFGGQDWDDLAIGAPVPWATNPGEVLILQGSTSGLTATGSVLLTQTLLAGREENESTDRFGWSLAVGDFGRGSRKDLAIGTPFEDVGSKADAGQVYVVYGGTSGLETSSTQRWTQDPLPGDAEGGDLFGFALAAGNYGYDNRSDLAVGSPGENHEGGFPLYGPTLTDVGAVYVIYGTDVNGLSSTNSHGWNSGSAGGGEESGAQFGRSLTTFIRRGFTDWLAVGEPKGGPGYSGEDFGYVYQLKGSSTGGPLERAPSSPWWYQNSPGIQDEGENGAEQGDGFGEVLG